MIRFERARFVYPDGRVAIEELDLHIRKGEFAALVGSSGSGKTTALRLINRLLSPTSGAVYVDGRNTASVDPIALRRGIGYAIQGVGLIGHMSVAENVALVPRLLGLTPPRQAQAASEGLKRVHLDPAEFMGRYPASLSGGQRQRVGIARALAADPDIVLMDEPFGALDTLLREEMQDEFKEIFAAMSKTVVFVTHDMHEAVHMADRIIVMNQGRVVSEGTPREVVLEPANDFVVGLLGRRRADLERYVKELS